MASIRFVNGTMIISVIARILMADVMNINSIKLQILEKAGTNHAVKKAIKKALKKRLQRKLENAANKYSNLWQIMEL